MATTTNTPIENDGEWHAVGTKSLTNVVESSGKATALQLCFAEDAASCPDTGHYLAPYKAESVPADSQGFVKNVSGMGDVILVVSE